MPIAVDPTKTWEYILKCDRGTDFPTRFVLAAISVADEARLQDAIAFVRDGATHIKSGTHTLDVLRVGLRGWHDFQDATGQLVPFKTDASKRMRGVDPVSDESLAWLTPEWRKELADAIIERNTLSEGERKNSSSAPAS